MSHTDLISRLLSAGCRLVRHGRKHDLWFSPITGKTRPVPRHGSKEVGTGLLKSLEKDLLGL